MFKLGSLCFALFSLLTYGVCMADEKATFAGGCFWCVESAFDALPGVISVTSGYTGGQLANPSYEEVSQGGTGHAEAVEILFNPSQISFKALLNVFWHNIDPTVKDRQFCDIGRQYRSAIFYHNAQQHQQALASLEEVKRTLNTTIYTEIVEASTFYPAEEYHQAYHKKNPIRYHFYRQSCGRDKRLESIWNSKE